MPDIKLYELGPTRSARCRWTLLEAGLEYESIAYTVNFGQELGWIKDFPHVLSYLDRLFDREHCTLVRFR